MINFFSRGSMGILHGKRRLANRASIGIAICLVVGSAFLLHGAFAQQQSETLKRRILGTWTLNSQYMKLQSGKTIEPYGPDSKGSFMAEQNGRFSFQVIGANRPKFKSGARREGTPEENAAAVFNTETFFGTFSVNESQHVLNLHLERAILPNWDGIDRSYKIIFRGDHLQLEGPPTPSADGPMVPFTDWSRVK